MMVYIIILYLLLVASHHYVNCDSICSSNERFPGRRLTLSGYNNDTGICECQITLKMVHLDPFIIKEIIVTQTHLSVNCDYRLSYWMGGNTNKIENRHENSTFTIELNGILYVRMENQVIGSGDLCFKFTVTTKSNDYQVDATCENLNKNTTETTPPTRTPPTTPASITTTPASTTTPHTTTTSYTASVSQTVDNVSPTTIVSTRDQTKIQATKEKIVNDNTDDDNSLLPIIMGCIIGVLVIILVIIITCFLIRRRNHQKNTNTENPSHGTNDMAVYSSLDDDLKGSSSQYEDIARHLPEQHVPEQQDNNLEHVSEQQEHVQITRNEYANVTKTSIDCPSENRTELNNNPNMLKITEGDYENLKESKT